MEKKEIRLVTAALPYVNNVPHIGNIVGSHLPADIYARYCRLMRYEVMFIGGTDEHGTPTEVSALKLGTTPEKLTDFFHNIHKRIYDWFNFSYDNFSRTSKSKIHYQVTKEIFLQIFRNGFIIEEEEELPYDPKANKFLPDRYVEGTCPYCGYDGARGDQCEKCGRLLDPKELINPRSVITNSPVTFKKTRHLYINLSALEEKLREWIESNKHWSEGTKSLALGWIKEGLKPRSITRDISWGIKVPYEELWKETLEKIEGEIVYPVEYNEEEKDQFIKSIVNALKGLNLVVPEEEVERMKKILDEVWPNVREFFKRYNYFEEYKNKVFYVWFDAPIGYLSFTIEKTERWKRYWSNPDAKIIHFIGKDNIPFHTIFWPGMLIAFNEGDPYKNEIVDSKLNLPYNVVGLQYLTYEGRKISKSRGWGVFCEKLPEAGLEPDYWRFYLSFLIPENRDTEFTWREFKEIINKQLIGNFGNFVNRVLTFIYRNYDGEIPEIDMSSLSDEDRLALDALIVYKEKVSRLFEEVKLTEALKTILELSNLGNKYFQESKPWEDPKGKKNALAISVHIVKALAIMLWPFIPGSSEKLLSMLNYKRDFSWEDIDKIDLSGKRIEKPVILFKKLSDEELEKIKKIVTKITNFEKVFKGEKQGTKMSDKISIDDLMRIDLRVGRVIEVKDHPNADKLYVLTVDLGSEKRTIVAGLKQYYKPEELLGKYVIVVTNLQPKKLRGIESQGMLLAADDGKVVALLQPDKEVELGAKIR